MHMCNCILTFEFHIIIHSLPRIKLMKGKSLLLRNHFFCSLKTAITPTLQPEFQIEAIQSISLSLPSQL